MSVRRRFLLNLKVLRHFFCRPQIPNPWAARILPGCRFDAQSKPLIQEHGWKIILSNLVAMIRIKSSSNYSMSQLPPHSHDIFAKTRNSLPISSVILTQKRVQQGMICWMGVFSVFRANRWISLHLIQSRHPLWIFLRNLQRDDGMSEIL